MWKNRFALALAMAVRAGFSGAEPMPKADEPGYDNTCQRRPCWKSFRWNTVDPRPHFFC